MPIPELTDDQLEQLISEKIQEQCPDLLTLFKNESGALIQSTKNRIQRVLALDSNTDVGNLVRAEVEKWAKEMKIDLAHREYSELMERQRIEPVSREKFSDPNSPSNTDVHRSFMRLKTMGITIGDKVRDKTKEKAPVLTVHTITYICRVNLANEDGQIVEKNVVNMDGYRKVD